MLMMNTKNQQLLILELLKEQVPTFKGDETYVNLLKKSLELEIARDVSIWWRSLQIERYCIITSNYLKLTTQFDSVVKAFYRTKNVSPYIERAGQCFLDFVQQNDDKLLVTIAHFEDKLKRVKKGDNGNYSIHWNYEPLSMLDSLIHGKPLQLESIKGSYLTIINANFENQFEVFNIFSEEESV